MVVRAVTCHAGELSLVDLPDPEPGPGQLVLRVRRTGICGSDLHARRHADELAEVMDELAYPHSIRSTTPTVLGHELCGEVVAQGSGTARAFPLGTRVAAFPLVRGPEGVHPIGLSPLAPGGYAEQVTVEASMSHRVPDDLDDDLAALTEPLAVAHHAVRRGAPSRRDTAVVLGCGPVGLAVVLLLKSRGVRTVVASDPSAARRDLARACGADHVVDPREESPWAVAPGRGWRTTAPELLDFAVGTMERLRRVPGWQHVNRAAERVGAADQPAPVVFECVGVPGMLDQVLAQAPLASRVVVVGVCMGTDHWRPSLAVNKELELRFVLGYTPLKFHDVLQMLGDGKVDPSPLLTGTVGLEGVAAAFDALEAADRHAKVLIDPSVPGARVRPVAR